MALAVVGDACCQISHEFWTLRPRADQAHVAREDVEQLWQLVQAIPAQDSAKRGYPVIAVARPARPAVAFRIDRHAAELVKPEGPSAVAHSLLVIQHGVPSAGFDEACQHDEHEEGRGQGQHYKRGCHVEDALRNPPADPESKIGGKDYPARMHLLELDRRALALVEGHEIRDLNAAELGFQQVIDRQGTAAII